MFAESHEKEIEAQRNPSGCIQTLFPSQVSRQDMSGKTSFQGVHEGWTLASDSRDFTPDRTKDCLCGLPDRQLHEISLLWSESGSNV